MKRFYKTVSVEPNEMGFQTLLDGRPLTTPAKAPLVCPIKGIAEAVAVEWDRQGETIEPTAMPVTRLASTAMDHMPARRKAALQEIVDYTGSDLLCYRAPKPEDLVRRQQDAWQPPLDWIGDCYDIHFDVTGSLLPVPQPKATVEGVRDLVARIDDWPLVGVHGATTSLGSVVLALALWHGKVDATAAADASLLDELFEIEQWGKERDACLRHGVLRRDIEGIALFLAHVPPHEGFSHRT